MRKSKIRKVLAGLSMVGLIAGMAGTANAEQGTSCGKGSCGSKGAGKEMSEGTAPSGSDMTSTAPSGMSAGTSEKAPAEGGSSCGKGPQ